MNIKPTIFTDSIISKKILPEHNVNYLDSEEFFQKCILPTQPDDWYYRHATVTCTLNSDGYRAPEFDTVDWANSVVILGCSNVFGHGLSDEHTISSQLSKLIDRPVINLGVRASSIQFATYNATMLAAGYPCPYAVIQMWTWENRCLLFDENLVNHLGSLAFTPGSYMDQWNQNGNAQAQALMFREISKQIWQSRTQYIEAAFGDSIFDCKQFDCLDHARDLVHPGIKTAAHIAAYFAREIK